MSKTFTLNEIAELVDGTLDGDGEREITMIAPLKAAGENDITYLESRKHLPSLAESKASCVIVDEEVAVPKDLAVIRVRQPGVAWAKVLTAFHPDRRSFQAVSPEAYIGVGVEIAEGVGIGPGAYIGDGASIGARSEIHPGATIGANAVVGEDCRLHSGVHVYHRCRIGDRVTIHSGAVIGADGYGYVQEKTGDEAQPVVHRKVPQVGIVIIEDDVEIGANTTIDRATLDATVIGHGSKVDNLVMVGHNCRTGSHCLVIAQVGLAGTITLGNYVTIAGQAGLAGHIKIGDGAVIGAKSGVISDVEAGKVMIGSPALPGSLARRAYAQIENLPEFRKQIKALNKKVAELEAKLADAD
jgi:UDP-3-O-[3-hydroxymyristoyl] glucosamine N-acyltransferase